MNSALEGRSVLVTGHTGFKGAWLTEWLVRLGCSVTGFALPPETSPSLFTLLGLAHRIRHVVGDVRSLDSLRECVDRAEPELIFHLAAQALVRPGYDDPVGTFGTNVMGTVNLLEAVRLRARPCGVVIVTSDKCYAPPAQRRVHEESDPLGGPDPYSASKACSEHVAESYRRSFFPVESIDEHRVAVASARAGNVIGGGDWATDRIVPDIARAVSSGRPILLRSPHAIRPWQHVLDACSGYLLLGSRLLTDPHPGVATSFNFGPTSEHTVDVRSLTDAFLRVWGAGHAVVEQGESTRRPEAPYLSLSPEKARRELGWESVLALEDAIRLTAEWYRMHYEDRNVGDRTREEIERYVSSASDAQLDWIQEISAR